MVHCLKQLPCRNSESLGDPLDGHESRIPLTPLDPTNVRTVDGYFVGEGFLGEASSLPQPSNGPAKADALFAFARHRAIFYSRYLTVYTL